MLHYLYKVANIKQLVSIFVIIVQVNYMKLLNLFKNHRIYQSDFFFLSFSHSFCVLIKGAHTHICLNGHSHLQVALSHIHCCFQGRRVRCQSR